jgi:ABC-type transport system involved in multi-copper enzyme maturation permease subunit
VTADVLRSGAPDATRPGFLQRLAKDPNAIWMREMRQAARLGRTPWILFSLTLTISLLMCSIGGLAAASNVTPAELGGALFQVFFSIAYLVVVIVGPTVAANSIASEREGRTWEAVLLTGLSPKDIARGKFLAAYTTISLYIVVLAPVGALSFLFGGVTATEVVVAFLFLFLLAGLAVAFGLAVSSLMQSLRGAIVVTLMLAVCVGPMLYMIFGFTCSLGIHELWPEVTQAYPIWLPIAYSRASFGPEYMLILVALPLLLTIVPAWFLYEATIANLTGESEDRSTGLKRWFAVTTPLLALACAVPSAIATENETRMALSVAGMCAFFLHIGYSVMLFASEPPGPSRRVRIHWDRSRAGAFRRFFGPGLSRTSVLVALLGVVGVVAIACVDLFFLRAKGSGPASPSSPARAVAAGEEILVFAVYAAPFLVFVVGLFAWLRARAHTPWVARLIGMAVLFLIAAGPWVAAAIGGVLSSTHDDAWFMVAAPSPCYAFKMISSVDRADGGGFILAGVVCAVGWALTGLTLLTAASRRCARMVAQHDAAVLQAEDALRAEDEAARIVAPPFVPATTDAPRADSA